MPKGERKGRVLLQPKIFKDYNIDSFVVSRSPIQKIDWKMHAKALWFISCYQQLLQTAISIRKKKL
jgi:hypothetical protein